MAHGNYYVDASIAGDSGTGTTGDPYGDLQYAINSVTQGSNGDTFWLSGSEVLVAALDFTGTYGASTYNTPCIIRSWNGADALTDGTTADNIDGNGTYAIHTQATSVKYYNLKLHNCGSAAIVSNSAAYHVSVIACEVTNTTGNGIVFGLHGTAIGNYVHDCGGYGINAGRTFFNFCKNTNASNRFGTVAISAGNAGSRVYGNIISVDGASGGISMTYYSDCINNSVYSNAGTGTGIITLQHTVTVLNNAIEGFSTGGGIGLSYNTKEANLVGGNVVHNCVTPITGWLNELEIHDHLDATGLGSPFEKSGADTFANRAAYFAATAAVQAGAYPSALLKDTGAVQHADPAGGAASILGLGGLKGGFA